MVVFCVVLALMTLTVPVVVTIREALSQFLKQVLLMERDGTRWNEVESRVVDCTPPGHDAGFTL